MALTPHAAAPTAGAAPPHRPAPGRTPDTAALLAAAVGAVPGGATRPGQVAMAEAITEAVRTGEHLLAQAGTGTGKSLAYLVPALATGRPVVVSTATLALQSQLVTHDLPRLVDAVAPLLGRRPTYALLKGWHHYLCLARLASGTADEQTDTLFDDGPQWLGAAGRLGQQVTRLRQWAADTDTGDRDELDPGVPDTAWRQVSMPARECIGPTRCPHGDDCFAQNARLDARAVDIVVTNHTLLAVDLLNNRHILPDHGLLVVDEAHELADRVTSAAQAELSGEAVSRLNRQVRSQVDADVRDALEDAAALLGDALATAPVGRLTTLPDPLRDALVTLDGAGRAALAGLGDLRNDNAAAVGRNQVRTLVAAVCETAQRLLDESARDVAWVAEDDRLRRSAVVAPLSVAGLLGATLFSGRTVVGTSATLAPGGRFELLAQAWGLAPEHGRVPPRASVAAAEAVPGNAVRGNAVRGNAVRDDAVRDDAVRDDAVRGDGADLVRGGAGEPVRGGTVGTDTADAARGGAGSAGGNPAPGAGPVPRWRALDVGSPFDYARQGILYVAARLPRPGASGLSDPARGELIELVAAAGGRTLGLFSSRRAAAQAAEALREATDFPVLLQGEDTLAHLVRQFRAEPTTCLLGVLSLWQGVDVPGPACQLVVIDRLPFPRPDEPLTAARAQVVDDAGGSGFLSVSVPVAAIRLAQGAGRLVRSATDRGVVAVLDPRLHTARYGEFIRRTLPPLWYTTSPEVVRGALRRLDADEVARGAGPAAEA